MYTAVDSIIGPGTTVDIERLINEAQLRLASMTHKVVSSSASVTDGTFILPDDCLALKGISFDGRDLTKWSGINVPDDQEGSPVWYGQVDDTVNIYPAASGTATIYYLLKPAHLSEADDEPELDNVGNVLIAYAVWKGKQEEQEADAQQWYAAYFDAESRWLDMDRKRHKRVYRIKPKGRFGYF